jgi:hypothetical protein
MKTDYEVGEFLNLINEKFLDNTIKSNYNDKQKDIDLISQIDGIFKVNPVKIYKLNMYNIFYITVIHNNYEIKKNQLVGKIFHIPENIEKKNVEQIIDLIDGPLINVLPYTKHNVAIVAVGEDLYKFKRDDGFNEKLIQKLSRYNGNIIYKEINEEIPEKIILSMKRALSCSDMIFVIYSKEMNTVLIDKTLDFLKISQTIPIFIFPGNNIKFFYLEEKPVLIIPEKVLDIKVSALNIILSRLFCGEKLNFEEMVKYSYGGICFFCSICIYPICPLGKY